MISQTLQQGYTLYREREGVMAAPSLLCCGKMFNSVGADLRSFS